MVHTLSSCLPTKWTYGQIPRESAPPWEIDTQPVGLASNRASEPFNGVDMKSHAGTGHYRGKERILAFSGKTEANSAASSTESAFAILSVYRSPRVN